MELILKTNNENSIAKIVALANKLNVSVELQGKIQIDKKEKQEIRERIMNFKATARLSFGEPVEWQNDEREDRKMPFSQ